MKNVLLLAGLVVAAAGSCPTGAAGEGGSFQIQRDCGRWRFVDPQGAPFFSTGVSSVTPGGSSCPALGYSPYGRRVMERHGTNENWASETLLRLRKWNFNTLGAWSDLDIFKGRMPYTVNLKLSPSDWQKGDVPDYWSQAFFDHVQKIVADQVAPRKDDPQLIGYFYDNELRWGPDWRAVGDVFDAYFNRPADSPGKIALVEWLRQRYHNDAEAFRAAWPVPVKSFDDLLFITKLPKALVSDQERADRLQFTGHVARQFFRTCHDAIRSADPKHLILGVRFVSWVTPREAVRAISDYTDVVSVNHYEIRPFARTAISILGEYLDWMSPEGMLRQYHQETGKPVLISEFSFRAKDSGLPNTWPPNWLFPVFRSQTDRADAFEKFARTAICSDYIVGYHWFTFADQPALGRFDGENSNFGLVNVDDVPWSVLTERMKEVNREAGESRGKSF